MQIQSWKQLNELQPKCSELYQALKSSAHLPVSTASAERSFSTMGRLKTYLRSTMTDKRLTGLALMNIHTDLEIYSEDILKQFDATCRRAMHFVTHYLGACVNVRAFLSPFIFHL